MGKKAGRGAGKATVGRPKAITVHRQTVAGVQGGPTRMKTLKVGRNKKTK